MTYISKEYEIKTKMEQKQWLLLKILFLLSYALKIVVQLGGSIFGGGDKNLLGGVYWGGFF